MKVYIVDGNEEYWRMFVQAGWELAASIGEADLVQFTGGADVSPELYGKKNTQSFVNVQRDLKDISIFREALSLDIPMAGICRGGQLLNVMSGGKMVQHVEGHANGHTHIAYDVDSVRYVEVTSTHHQMMLPGRDSLVLMVANIVCDEDTEAVYYAHTRALCFQPHPEFGNAPKECRDLYFKYINELFRL